MRVRSRTFASIQGRIVSEDKWCAVVLWDGGAFSYLTEPEFIRL